MGRSPEGEAVTVEVRQLSDQLLISIRTPGFFLEEREIEGTVWSVLELPHGGWKAETGWPQMPFHSIRVPIPRGPSLGVPKVSAQSAVVLRDVQIIPASPPEPDCGTCPSSLDPERVAYGMTGDLPDNLANIAADVVIRGQRMVFLEIFPLLYNPAERTVAGAADIEVQIPLVGMIDQAAEEMKTRRRSALFPTAIDANEAQSASDLSAPAGVEYLILAADELVPSVEPLAQWKRLKGLTVETVAVSTVGASPAAIQTFLESRYASDPDLSYVLLVGDHEQLPSQNLGSYVSDLPYSCLDGPDEFPDVVLGRISVQTSAESDAVVSKIVSYERHPDPGEWHRSFLMAAYLQDNNDFNCIADRWFFETGTHAMHFVRDTVGMEVGTAANSSNTCSPYHWRSSSYPHRFDSYAGQPVPVADAALITSSSQATHDIITAIEAGTSIVQHRDHGATWGWGDPPFTTSHARVLNNGSRYPVVLSINCLTGTFNLSGEDCFAEAILKKEPGGAVGVIAASEVSYSGYNDLLTHGLYDCFWDDYDPVDGGNPYPHSFRPAEALLYAKAYMHQWMGVSSYTELEFQIFHWFGDPEMSVTTDVPVTPIASAECPLPVGAPSLAVSSDSEGALVAVTRGGQLLGRAFTKGGVAIVPLDPAPTAPGLLDVVVSGHNLAPLELSCQVILPEGPWLTVASHAVLDGAGNGDGIVNPGEVFVLPITVANIGAEGGTDLTGMLSTSSQWCTVTDQHASFPDLAVGQSATSEPDNFSLQVDSLAPHGTLLPLTLDWTANGPYAGSAAFWIRVCEELEISSVQITDVADGSARVSWSTNVPATSSVAYGIASASEQEASSSELVTEHTILLTDLDECTRYLVEVASESPGCYLISDEGSGSGYGFTTLGRHVLLFDDAETGDLGWQATTPWQISDEAAFSPTHAWTDSPGGSYANNRNVSLTSPPLDLSAETSIRLRFATTYDLEPGYDYGYIEASVNGFNWQPLAALNGSQPHWTRQDIDLAPYSGSPSFQVRFRLATDGAVTGDGLHLDDIEISSLRSCSEGKIAMDRSAYTCDDTIRIAVTDIDLDSDPTLQETTSVVVTSDSDPIGEQLTLSETNVSSTVFTGTIGTAAGAAGQDGQLSLSDGDTIVATYEDLDHGDGVPITVTAGASSDCAPPVLSAFEVMDVGPDWAEVSWQTNEAADSSLAWDTAIPPSAGTKTDPAMVLSHALRLDVLAPCTTYYLMPSSMDVAGQTTRDDNGGQYHVLATNLRILSATGSVDTPGPIPDDDLGGFHSAIGVGQYGEVRDVDVWLDISHPWDADLDLWLIGPDGTRVELTTDNGGSGSDYRGTLFDDQAAVSVLDASAPFSGPYRPEQPLSALNGISSLGVWTLEVQDDLDGAVGVLDGWELKLELYRSCDALEIFADGFEASNDSAWSSSGP